MLVTLTWKDKQYRTDLSQQLPIAITLQNDIRKQPNAFGAPPYEASPHRDGDFVGDVSRGSPVNFFNIRINPHGNGTHTECAGHILPDGIFIQESLSRSHFIAELVSVYATRQPDGQRCITRDTLAQSVQHEAEALIVRTLPNPPEKCYRKYTGTDPAFFDVQAVSWVHERGYLHLLTDLPSIDPEADGGALVAHKMFWQVQKSMRRDRTITEMIYVKDNVADGLYLLEIQIAPLALDASPSLPVLYKLEEIE